MKRWIDILLGRACRKCGALLVEYYAEYPAIGWEHGRKKRGCVVHDYLVAQSPEEANQTASQMRASLRLGLRQIASDNKLVRIYVNPNLIGE